ncbi:DUF1056 family protein [Weissella confusa]|uniref:DUF1056 family protein n=1 Tax=Weissella confusa TaxID=1583 RepID=UPI0022FDD296|nr:DUF1056 family protein [Weissella confusa]MDY2528737.1 DUF1056 family protein [Weissella confusa]
MIINKMRGFARAIRARLDIILFISALVAFVSTMFLTINALAGGISLTIALAIAGYGVVIIDNGTNINRKE